MAAVKTEDHWEKFLIGGERGVQYFQVNSIFFYYSICAVKGIVSRDFVVCFLVSFNRSHISTHEEWVLLLVKVCFLIEFFDFRVWA
jgi:hypothetical protein